MTKADKAEVWRRRAKGPAPPILSDKAEPLAHVTQAELDQVADQLNGRPRETLGWRTPAEALAELLKQSAAS